MKTQILFTGRAFLCLGLLTSSLTLVPASSYAQKTSQQPLQAAIRKELHQAAASVNALQHLLDVVPDELYKNKRNSLDMIPPFLQNLNRLVQSMDYVDGQVIYFRKAAEASGSASLVAQAAELEALLKSAPTASEISAAVLRVLAGGRTVGAGQVTEIVRRVTAAQNLLLQLETALKSIR